MHKLILLPIDVFKLKEKRWSRIMSYVHMHKITERSITNLSPMYICNGKCLMSARRSVIYTSHKWLTGLPVRKERNEIRGLRVGDNLKMGFSKPLADLPESAGKSSILLLQASFFCFSSRRSEAWESGRRFAVTVVRVDSEREAMGNSNRTEPNRAVVKPCIAHR
jgi:hypothetical protein